MGFRMHSGMLNWMNRLISITIAVVVATNAITTPLWGTRSFRFINATNKTNTTFRLLSLLPNDSIYSSDMRYILPSLDYIAYTLSEYSFSDYFSLYSNFEPSTCSNLAAISAMEYYYKKEVDGFLGLPCPESCGQVVQYSRASWNIPVVSIGAVEPIFRDISNMYKHSVFVRLSFDGGAFSRSIIDIFMSYNYTKFFAVYTMNSGYAKDGCHFMIEDLYKQWQEKSDKFQAEYYCPSNSTLDEGDLNYTFARIGNDFGGNGGGHLVDLKKIIQL